MRKALSLILALCLFGSVACSSKKNNTTDDFKPDPSKPAQPPAPPPIGQPPPIR